MFGVGEVLLPLLTGLFGVPVLLLSMRSTAEAPPQRFFRVVDWQQGDGLERVAGAIVGWGGRGFRMGRRMRCLRSGGTGILREQMHAGIWLRRVRRIRRMRFWGLRRCMRSVGGEDAERCDGCFGVAGAASVVFCGVGCGGCCAVGYGLTIAASRSVPVLMRVNQRVLARGVLVFLVVVSFVFCGPFGLLILAAATLVGRVPGLLNVSRIFCMGAVMVPMMLFTLDVIRF